ncbi:TagK domain-containing protein [Enterobacteriaceae bacterium LUAb1]
MLLQIVWPKLDRQMVLTESVTPEKAQYFCLETGEFLTAETALPGDALCFYWHYPEPVMINMCEEFVCSVDGQLLASHTQVPLRYNSKIQAGPFLITVKMARSEGVITPIKTEESLHWSEEQEPYELPEVETLLTHGGQYAGYLDEAETLQDQDVLKHLEFEYKRYLIWDEQGRNFMNKVHHEDLKLPANDTFLENITESVKDKTMTECIFDQGNLIERVIDELMAVNQLDISEEEEHPDLLALLAPEQIAKKEKRIISELVFKELYKLGLDSYL